jgi:5-methyltetrahydrofolate--homocysteine methyltransferase
MTGMNVVGDLSGKILPQSSKIYRVSDEKRWRIYFHTEAAKQVGDKSGTENPDGYRKRGRSRYWKILFRILACNNYEIVDLGHGAPEKTIAAIEHNVDIIGLSGLITHRWTKWFISRIR